MNWIANIQAPKVASNTLFIVIGLLLSVSFQLDNQLCHFDLLAMTIHDQVLRLKILTESPVGKILASSCEGWALFFN